LLSPADHPDIADVLSIYQQWDRKTDTGSQGAAVFKILYDYVVLKMKIWPDKILNNSQIIESLNHVRNYQVKYFGRTGITLGDLQKHVRGEKEYPSWGIPDVLTAMYSSDYRNGRLKVRAGESYIELVRFPQDGLPIIESVNCYGASNRKDSPHFDDQMEMFLNKQTKPMSLEKEKVLREAKIIYHPGKK
jgi:acyl-homoserine-lactone acylase